MMVRETTQGAIEFKLMPEIALKVFCENFMKLAEKKYYEGIVFHRIIKEFMIQGGDPTETRTGGESIWGKNFKDEFSTKVNFNSPYLALANRGPDINGSQFFITTIETPWLNQKHTIFGKAIKGENVADKLEKIETSMQNKPVKPQKIVKLYIKETL